jgi:hypothetical protein
MPFNDWGRYQRFRAHFWGNRQIVPVCAEAGITRRDMPKLPRVKPKLAMVALLASLAAKRAALVDPKQVLRTE